MRQLADTDPATQVNNGPADSTTPRALRVLLQSPALLAGTTLLVLLFVGQALVVEHRNSHLQGMRKEVAETASSVHAALEGVVRADLSVLAAIAAVFSSDPAYAAARFPSLAANLIDTSYAIRHIALAPDLVITAVYPLTGNEAALGLDYRQTPEQREMAMRARTSGATILVGPQALVQGGTGFIARRAVLIRSEGDSNAERFWGLIVVVLDPQRIYAAAGLANHVSLQFALERSNAATGGSELVFGDAAVLASNPVRLEVDFSTGDTWSLYAIPGSGWSQTGADRFTGPLAHALAALLALLTALLVYRLSRDRNQLERSTQQLATAQALRLSINTAIPDLMFLLDEAGTLLEYHAKDERQLYLAPDRFLSRRVADVMPESVATPVMHMLARALQSGCVETLEYELNGHHMEARLVAVADRRQVLCIARDITARYASEEKMRLAMAIVEQAGEGIMLLAPNGHIVMVNDAFTRITGYSAEEVLGRTPDFLHPPDEPESFYEDIRHTVRKQRHWSGQLRLLRNGDVSFPAHLVMSDIRKPDGTLEHLILIVSDISESERSRDAIQHLLTHDPLTDLANAALLREQVDSAVQEALRHDRRLALLYLSVDQFQAFNATLGRQATDQLLQVVAGRLQQHCRDQEVLARVGSRTFALLARAGDGLSEITRRATALQRSFDAPLTLEDSAPIISLHIGIARFPEDARTSEQLLTCAESALFDSRRQSDDGHSIRFYDAALTQTVKSRIELERRLRLALQHQELLLHYQPIYTMASGQLAGFEALLRWQRPGEPLLYPAAFVDIIEGTDLVYPIGRWVIETAAAQLHSWRQAGLLPPPLNINIAAQQVLGGRLADDLQSVTARFQLPPQSLRIEILERVLVSNHQRALSELRRIRKLGIGIALDDFGTGYSSLSYLREFPVDILKIDRSFIHPLAPDSDKLSIVRAIIAMAHNLGILVTAEGVETEAEWDLLKALDCDQAQGWLRGRPMDAERAKALLTEQ